MSRWLVPAAASFAVTLTAILGGPVHRPESRRCLGRSDRAGDAGPRCPHLAVQFPTAALDWGIASIAWHFWSPGSASEPAIGPRSGRGWCAWPPPSRSSSASPESRRFDRPSVGNQDTLALLLAGSPRCRRARDARESEYRRFLRMMLAAPRLTEMLQVYPVAGSQVGIAAVTFVPIGAICLADGLTALRAWEQADARSLADPPLRSRSSAVSDRACRDVRRDDAAPGGQHRVFAYHELPALPFAGATALHRTLRSESKRTPSLVEENPSGVECSTLSSATRTSTASISGPVSNPRFPARARGLDLGARRRDSSSGWLTS